MLCYSSCVLEATSGLFTVSLVVYFLVEVKIKYLFCLELNLPCHVLGFDWTFPFIFPLIVFQLWFLLVSIDVKSNGAKFRFLSAHLGERKREQHHCSLLKSYELKTVWIAEDHTARSWVCTSQNLIAFLFRSL